MIIFSMGKHHVYVFLAFVSDAAKQHNCSIQLSTTPLKPHLHLSFQASNIHLDKIQTKLNTLWFTLKQQINASF